MPKASSRERGIAVDCRTGVHLRIAGVSGDFLPIYETLAMKNSILAAALLLALMGGAARAQTAAPAATPAQATPVKANAASSDPIVVMRAEQRAARNAFTEATRPIRAERAATVKAAEEKAVAEAKAAGKDPLVARRNANRAAMAATRADFEAKMKGPTATRDAALAAATAKRNAASK
jgi:hypothetical protein